MYPAWRAGPPHASRPKAGAEAPRAGHAETRHGTLVGSDTRTPPRLTRRASSRCGLFVPKHGLCERRGRRLELKPAPVSSRLVIVCLDYADRQERLEARSSGRSRDFSGPRGTLPKRCRERNRHATSSVTLAFATSARAALLPPGARTTVFIGRGAFRAAPGGPLIASPLSAFFPLILAGLPGSGLVLL